MTFTDAQQKAHRKAFIEECRQKAWSNACHADFIGKSIDDLLAQHAKLQEEDRTLEADIKEADSAIDYHTVDNRQKRKAMQEKRNVLAQQMKFLSESAQQGYRAMQQFQANVETNLALAEHAERWEWNEVEAAGDESSQKGQPATE